VRSYAERSAYKVNRDTLLLTVEDHFLIEGRGLIVVPHLDIPPAPRRFTPFSDDVRIQRPDGTEQTFSTQFLIEHVSLQGGGSKWNIVPMMPMGTKETIPIGSHIFVRADTMMKLNGHQPPNAEHPHNVT
jgi:hypothetical protein